MSLQYIIDGYNIINNPLFIEQASKGINPAVNLPLTNPRQALIEFILANQLCGSRKNKITLIFDGYPDSSNCPAERPGIDVIFSGQETADERIKKIVEGSANPRNIMVVSNDKGIIFSVKPYGSRVSNIEDFIGRKDKKLSSRRQDRGSAEPRLNYSQMHKINQELREKWLK